MTAEAGAGFLLKISDGGSPETFTTVAGLRTTSMTVTGASIEVTNKESAGWRELLDGAGVRRVSVNATGVFMNAESERRVRQQVFSGALTAYRLVFANGDQVNATFQVTSLNYAGDHNNERSYTLSLESSGPVTVEEAA